MKFIIRKKNKAGFALLFSVLVSSLLLTIGLSIFSIALKELAISTAARQSIHAFYAADSGRECAKYWDTKKGNIATLINDQNGGTIHCNNFNGTPFNNKASNQVTGTITTAINGAGVAVDELHGPNFNFTITKSRVGSDPTTKIDTTITSIGHDTDSGDRVERAIEQTY